MKTITLTLEKQMELVEKQTLRAMLQRCGLTAIIEELIYNCDDSVDLTNAADLLSEEAGRLEQEQEEENNSYKIEDDDDRLT